MHKKAQKRKEILAQSREASPSYEAKAFGGYSPRQHQDVVPVTGQGPYGNCKAIVPWGAAPAVAAAPVGAGRGFMGVGPSKRRL